MAIQKTDAIILRRQEIRETSLILIAFTRELGKVHGLLKGVRGAGAAVPWYLEPLTLQSVVLYERKRSAICLMSSCDLIDAFDPLRRDFTRLAYGGFCLDVVDAMTELGDPHPEVFDLLLAALRALGAGADPKSTVRFLEIQMLKIGGMLPPGGVALSAGAKLSLQQILQTPASKLAGVRLVPAVEKELRGMAHGLLRRALERDLKSRSFLWSVGLEGAEQGAARGEEAA